MATAASLQTIQQFYVAYYGRPADPAGLEFWATQLDTAGGVLTAVLDAFGTSAEATTRYGTGTNDAKVTNLYQQILGRAPDTAGLRFYSDKLTDGTFTLATVAKRIVDGIPAGSTDATTLANKTTMANSFTDTLKTDTAANAGYSGDDAAARARTWLDAVRDTATTVTTAQTNLAATITDIKPVSLTLTTGQDKFTATTTVAADKTSAVGDTITGATSALTSGNTLNNGDVIGGGSGTDTLKVNLAADFTGFVTGIGSATSIEVLDLVNVTPSSGTAENRSFDASGITGVTTVKLDMNDKNFTLTDLMVGDLRVEVTNADASTYSGALSIAADADSDAADGSADTLTLVLNSVKSFATVTAGDFENLTVISNGTNSSDLSLGGAKTITISGSGKLTGTKVDASVTTVDASAATGIQVLDLSSATGLKIVKGGSASDVITVDGIAVDAQITDGGGSADQLILDDVNGTKQPTISGFETITLTGITAAATISASKVTGVSTLELTDGLGAAVTISDLPNSSLAVVLQEDDDTWDGNGSSLTLTGTAALDISAETSDTTETSTINTGITAANASSVTLTVGESITYSGALTAAKATSATVTVAEDASLTGTVTTAAASKVTLNIDGSSSGAISASKATSVVINLGENSAFTSSVTAAAANTVTITSSDTDNLTALKLVTAKATEVSISSASEIGFHGDTDLSAIQRLTLSGDEGATTPAATLFGDASSAVTVDAANLKGDLTATIGDYASGTGSANVIGTSLGTNTITISGDRNEVTITGGIGDDTVTFDTVRASTDQGTYKFDLGSTSTGDTVKFVTATNLSASTVTFTGVDIINFGNGTGSGTLLASSVSGLDLEFAATGDVTLSGTTAANSIDLSLITATAGTVLTVNAGSGADTITGGESGEVLNGDAAADSISGGSGNDTISGGASADTMTGGAGTDVFLIGGSDASAILRGDGTTLLSTAAFTTLNASNADVITDFNSADDDLLALSATLNYSATWTVSGASVVDNGVLLAKGTYDSTTKIFTYNSSATTATAGYATIVIYDTDADVGTTSAEQSMKAVVLVGYLYDATTNNTTDTDSGGSTYTGLSGNGG